MCIYIVFHLLFTYTKKMEMGFWTNNPNHKITKRSSHGRRCCAARYRLKRPQVKHHVVKRLCLDTHPTSYLKGIETLMDVNLHSRFLLNVPRRIEDHCYCRIAILAYCHIGILPYCHSCRNDHVSRKRGQISGNP